VYGAALVEYLARHAPDEVTEAMDRVGGEVGGRDDSFVNAAAQHILGRSEW
jgi:hypothetical protein